MKYLFVAVVFCVALGSCSGSLQSLQTGNEYKNRSFFDKKILIAPFSRDQMVFANAKLQSRFDSLDVYCGGRLADSLSSSFTSAALNGLQTINGIPPEWTAQQKAAFFQAQRDPAAMVKIDTIVGKKQLTFFIPGRSVISTLASGANMVCYVQKTGSMANVNNYHNYFMDYVLYDFDAGRIVSAGSLAPDLSTFEAAKLTDKNIDSWVTRFKSFGPSLIKESPFGLKTLTKGRPVMFTATYSTAFLTRELKVKVDRTMYDTSLIKTADTKIKKLIVDSIVKPGIKKLASEIKEYSLKSLSGFSNKQDEERMKACVPLRGLVCYIGTVDSSKTIVIHKFSDNFKDQSFAAMIDNVFNTTGTEGAPDATAGVTKFILPIVVSVGPEESKGTYFNPNQFPLNNMPKPPIPRF
jgi:hypothetical protein